MKGIVFTSFLEMVEEKFGLETVDILIEKSNLPSKGIYTTVGTYEFNEIVSLITELSKKIDLPPGDLIYTFGLYLFSILSKTHPGVIQNFKTPISLLYSIEDHIHVHVKKLYPDAELPTFIMLNKTDTSISFIYKSSRGLYRLAHGLIEMVFEHFNGKADITYELLKQDGTEVKFNIVQNG
ncbi:heme NO-binding domain-containing protein [Maribacter arcticus]|uniref:heme NO-binding domain-containing protein n=1 Tax=Maribacter arcticus TaxID=561365 RepID=UPI003002FA56